MNARIESNRIVLLVYVFLFVLLLMLSEDSIAQSGSQGLYKGVQVGFGIRSFKLKSDIPQINHDVVQQAGGRVGLIFGNETLRSRIGLLGYYSSYNGIAGTVDLFETNLAIDFYPLSLILNKTPRLAPYLTTDVAYDKVRFYGHYLNEDVGKINYSALEAPYLGSLDQFNGSIGVGIEFKALDQYDFVHLFSEVRYGYHFANSSAKDQFENTSMTQPVNMNVGVRFGSCR